MRVDDIQYVLDELGSGNYRRSGDHLMASCPLAPWTHSGVDKNPSFGVLVTQGMAACNCFNPTCFPFKEGQGTLLNLVREVGRRKKEEGAWTDEEVNELISFILLTEDEDVDHDWGQEVEVMPLPPELLELLGHGSPYWRQRGVSEDTAREWRLGEGGNRALIPVMDKSGDIVAVQGRLVDSDHPDDYSFDKLSGVKPHAEKYRTWPVGFKRERHLAGEHLVARPVEFLLVVESPPDAVLANDWLKNPPSFIDLPDTRAAVATLGGKVAADQKQLLVESLAPGGELVLGFDTDNAGRHAALKTIDSLKRRLPSISVVEWKRKDPSDRGTKPVSMDALKGEFFRALAEREDWFTRELRKTLV